MANEPDQLLKEYTQLIESLALYPNITIVKVDGEPPDEYEIEYNLRAYVRNGGNIEIQRRHRILITLPFGYPHFAPVVKTLTPLFHPAINQNSISIDQYWEKRSSLPDLIVHIGEMISGHFYKSDKPANPEAAAWYREHDNEFPLDAPAAAHIGEEGLIDDFDDDIVSSLQLDDAVPNVDMVEQIPDFTPEIEEILQLAAQNQTITTAKRLAELPLTAWFPERDEIQSKVDSAIEKAAKLFLQAQEEEDDDNYDKALQTASRILELIPDDPAAKSLQQRLQQSATISDSLFGLDDEEKELKENKETTKSKEQDNEEKEKKTARKISLPSNIFPQDFPLYRLLLIILSLLTLYFASTRGLRDWGIIQDINSALSTAQFQINNKNYSEARDALEEVRGSARDLTLLRFRRSSLENKINSLLLSPEMQKGSEGQVLFRGQYVDKEIPAAIEALESYEDQAKAASNANQLDKAMSLLQEGTKHISGLKIPVNDSIKLRNQLGETSALIFIRDGEDAERKNDFAGAITLYQKAVSALPSDSNSHFAQQRSELLRRISGLALQQNIDKILVALDNSQLQEAQALLSETEQKLAANPQTVSEEDKAQLQAARIQTQIYQILPTAKEAFEKRQWEKAALQYQDSLRIIDNASPAVQQLLKDIREKISYTLQLAYLNQRLEDLKQAENKKDWPAVVALEQQLLTQLKGEELGNDASLAGLKEQLLTQNKNHAELLDHYKKGEWLEKNASEFFKKNFPTFKEESFSEVKALFVRKEGSKQIFAISYRETGGSASSTLVLTYAYDEKDGQWSRYTSE